jgi:protein-S-isoprenylcysteine O-methyltransferase Ste14
MNEDSYRLLAAGIFVLGASISIYFRRRAEKESGGEKVSLKHEGLALMISLRVVGMALWLGVFAYLINPDWILWAHVRLPTWARLLGAAPGMLADGLAYWVFSSLGKNVTPTVITRDRHELVTTGPYRWVRHPLYSIGFLSYISFALLAANWYVAVLSMATLILIAVRVPKEEEALIARNGDVYRHYVRRTGRFLPRFG